LIKSYAYLTVEQNQHLAVLKARAKARAEYTKQGICTDLFFDDFVADCKEYTPVCILSISKAKNDMTN
jgi:hypothetical protein